MGNHEARHDWPRCGRDALSEMCLGIHNTRQSKIEIIRKEAEILGIQDV